VSWVDLGGPWAELEPISAPKRAQKGGRMGTQEEATIMPKSHHFFDRLNESPKGCMLGFSMVVGEGGASGRAREAGRLPPTNASNLISFRIPNPSSVRLGIEERRDRIIRKLKIELACRTPGSADF